MKFIQNFSFGKTSEFREKFFDGIWIPNVNNWRDVIEDYLYISRKRINNKLSMFKLQLNILMDMIDNVKSIDSYKSSLIKLEKEKEQGLITEDDFNEGVKYVNTRINGFNIINMSLREIVDGIVWRYLKFNRPILYYLADKQEIGPPRPDAGLIESLNQFTDIFLSPNNFAILNDISNFLRVGDITKISEDGTIELIEVKSGKRKRGRRITRQKQRMSELVEFFNTGFSEYDGQTFKINDSNIKKIHYFGNLLDSIKRARNKGYDSTLIGNYLIIEVVDLRKVSDIEIYEKYFQKKHESVKERWNHNRDILIQSLFIQKLRYSRNYIPYSIYPYDTDICTDIIMGRLMIKTIINYSEIFRSLRKAGWQIIDSVFLKSEKELKELDGKPIKGIPFLTINKLNLTINVPAVFIGMLQFELLSFKTFVDIFEELYQQGPDIDYDASLINFTDDQRIWK